MEHEKNTAPLPVWCPLPRFEQAKAWVEAKGWRRISNGEEDEEELDAYMPPREDGRPDGRVVEFHFCRSRIHRRDLEVIAEVHGRPEGEIALEMLAGGDVDLVTPHMLASLKVRAEQAMAADEVVAYRGAMLVRYEPSRPSRRLRFAAYQFGGSGCGRGESLDEAIARYSPVRQVDEGARPEPPWPDLDPGIRGTVHWLWSHGFRPTDSGDGRSKLKHGLPLEDIGALDFPHVFCLVEARAALIDEADRLDKLICDRMDIAYGCGHVEVAYSPGGPGLVMLRGLGDEDLCLSFGMEGSR